MVCIICFDVLALIKFLKHDRYSSKVTKLINNLNVTYTTFHWLNWSGHALHKNVWIATQLLFNKDYR